MTQCQQKEGVESGNMCVCVCVCVFCFPVDDINTSLNDNGDKSVEGVNDRHIMVELLGYCKEWSKDDI